MLKKSDGTVEYRCPTCDNRWSVSVRDTRLCLLQLCKKCDRMVGLGLKTAINFQPAGEENGSQT